MTPARLLLPLLFAVALAPLATGQTLTFADGRTASLATAKIVGDTVRLPLELGGGASGEINLPVSTIVRLDWPEPPELAEAKTLLAAGRDADALGLLDKILPVHAPFKDISGSWWAKLTALRLRAQTRLGRDIDATVSLELLRRSKTGAGLVPGAVLDIVSALVDANKPAEARKQLDLASTPADDEVVAARIALLRGRLLLAENKPEDALLSFLRVRALHPRVAEHQPAALLGAIACYKKLGETARAETAREQLRSRYPDSPEAAKAFR
jgi:hypothetical protein